MRPIRPLSAIVFVLALSALVGGTFGRRAFAVDDKVPEHYKTYAAALSAIESQYVDTVESDRLVYGSIRGMLGTLDPHSSFFDPKEYAQMRERQEGRYYGLGITIQALNGDIMAMSVFEGSPAYKVGIRRGDVLANIEGQSAKGWTSEQAMKTLRGQKGTVVKIEIRRRGFEQLIPLNVTRDEVQILTVPAAFMIDGTTGYIRHQEWGENTDAEMRRALADLRKSGMKRLLYDIRGNPGGPLDQAIKVSNEFLPRGKAIVSTHGRIPNSDQDYRATEDSTFTDVPMVVLANRSSASASEIFTGALQDHDRAYIVGETTFGKALVQSVYRVQNAGLALTTAHYYTPSGRLIQRPWDESFDEYLSYTQKDQDANKAHNPSDLKRSDSGRPRVYRGGGIEPDKYVAGQLEGFNPTQFGRLLYSRQEFENYAQQFMAEGDTRITVAGTSLRALPRNFTISDEMVGEFRKQLETNRLKIDEAAFQKDLEFIKAMLRFRIDEALFGIADARRHLIAVDPQAQVALTMFTEAEKLAGVTRPTRAH